jgi:hypothetical protein
MSDSDASRTLILTYLFTMLIAGGVIIAFITIYYLTRERRAAVPTTDLTAVVVEAPQGLVQQVAGRQQPLQAQEPLLP